MSNKIALAAALLALAWAFLRWFERANLYVPERGYAATPRAYGLDFVDARIRTPDGETLAAWYVPNGEAAPLLVYFHGNGGNISSRLEKVLALRALGFSVLLFDYRGYGESTGRPSERGTYVDGRAAVAWLSRRLGRPPAAMLYYGESLGCAIALQTALDAPPRGLILDSGFASTAAMGREVFPFLPVRLMVRYLYDNVGKIPRLPAPLLVIHSPQDDVIPFAQGRAVFAAAPEPKTFLEIRGDHNEGWRETAHWRSGIAAFLKTLRP